MKGLILNITSTSKGILIPRMNTPSSLISVPATGLMAYNSGNNTLQFYNGTAWDTYGSLAATQTFTGQNTLNGKTIFGNTAQLKGYTVSTLPTGTQGMTAYVTDAAAPTFGVAVLGSGSTVIPVFYNGSAWIAY